MQKFYGSNLELFLEQSGKKWDRFTPIPNDHVLMTKPLGDDEDSLVYRVSEIAKVLLPSEPLDNILNTEYTFAVKHVTVEKSDEPPQTYLRIYVPTICLDVSDPKFVDGKPAVAWGDKFFNFDIMGGDLDYEIEQEGNFFFLVLDIPDIGCVKIPVRVNPETTVGLLYKPQKFCSALAAFDKSSKFLSLADLKPGDYQVVGYSRKTSFPGYNLDVVTTDGEVKVSSNTKLNGILEGSPLISKDKPATLSVGLPTKKYLGKPVIPVSLKLTSMIDLDFDL